MYTNKIKNFKAHSLMENNINKEDVDVIIKFLKNKKEYLLNQKVKEFETKWSKWLGVKYSVFVTRIFSKPNNNACIKDIKRKWRSNSSYTYMDFRYCFSYTKWV